MGVGPSLQSYSQPEQILHTSQYSFYHLHRLNNTNMGRFLYYLVLLGLLISRAQLAPVNEELDNEISDEVDNTEDVREKDVSPSVVDPEEIKKFNNYMDAVYRRMNAALRAKLMDPMELKLEPKERKKDKETPRKGKNKNKDKKKNKNKD